VAGQRRGCRNLAEFAVVVLECSLANGTDPQDAVRGLAQDADGTCDSTDALELVLSGQHTIQSRNRADPERAILGLEDGFDTVLACLSAQRVLFGVCALQAQKPGTARPKASATILVHRV